MKPPARTKPAPGEVWRDLMPRQGRDPGDYPSVFDELDDATRDRNDQDGPNPTARRGSAKAGGKVVRKRKR